MKKIILASIVTFIGTASITQAQVQKDYVYFPDENTTYFTQVAVCNDGDISVSVTNNDVVDLPPNAGERFIHIIGGPKEGDDIIGGPSIKICKNKNNQICAVHFGCYHNTTD